MKKINVLDKLVNEFVQKMMKPRPTVEECLARLDKLDRIKNPHRYKSVVSREKQLRAAKAQQVAKRRARNKNK